MASLRRLFDRVLLSLLALFTPTVASAADDVPAVNKAGAIEIEQRVLDSKKYGKIKHEIGTLYVPENRSDPDSRIISVGFARYPSCRSSFSLAAQGIPWSNPLLGFLPSWLITRGIRQATCSRYENLGM